MTTAGWIITAVGVLLYAPSFASLYRKSRRGDNLNFGGIQSAGLLYGGMGLTAYLLGRIIARMQMDGWTMLFIILYSVLLTALLFLPYRLLDKKKENS